MLEIVQDHLRRRNWERLYLVFVLSLVSDSPQVFSFQVLRHGADISQGDSLLSSVRLNQLAIILSAG